ncbi:hypothetical protein MHBO_004963 [Bonamia ostreae]|uniref:Uncharacterized protein n=1 Tax=Bonamia ostreae TaxID=126728 RepID=A0ABV2AUS5_9EUKA
MPSRIHQRPFQTVRSVISGASRSSGAVGAVCWGEPETRFVARDTGTIVLSTPG